MKVIKIGAVWCNGCIVMRPRWKEIEAENPWLQTEYYDFDTDTKQIKKYNLEKQKLPTFIFLDKNNNEIMRLSGEVEKNELIQTITKYKEL